MTHQPGVYEPLRALFSSFAFILGDEHYFQTLSNVPCNCKVFGLAYAIWFLAKNLIKVVFLGKFNI